MKALKVVATTALVLAAASGTAAAQEAAGTTQPIKSPVFVFMPSVVTVNAISAPEGAEAKSYFNLRFQTTIPTATPWITPVVGTQWLPNGPGGNNTPLFFYGVVIPLIQPQWTGGWLSASIDPLGIFAAGLGGEENRRAYGHDFFLELAVAVPIGAKMMREMGQFSNLAAFLLFDQQISRIPEGADKFNPILVWGLALPLAPWGR